MDPISYYESLIKGEHEGTFHSNWPADWIASFGKEIISGMNCMSAWKVIPAGVFVALVNTVKNRILSFVLEIEAEQPDAGEASPDTSPIPQERVSQVFNNIILGNVTTLTTGSQIISHTEINVVENNLESLDKFLNSIGLERQDLEELHEAINKDAQNDNKGDIGDKVSGWIDKMKAKAKSGVWNIAIATATHLLTRAILTYYGIVE
ncbi:unnamed protein product [marine sediment metagenome]|uniref:AbiTii domain-containing protein n=1 Tax=marine sediment metagenome TaxID=412755 RepID=X1VIT1_9ZZZZ